MSIYTYIHMYKENVQLKNPLYAAFCVTKGGSYGNKILYKNLAVEDFVTLLMGKKSC